MTTPITVTPIAPASQVSACAMAVSARADVPSLVILAGFNEIHTAGYATVGDGGAAFYTRVDSEPDHAGKVQSADGAWWEIAEPKLSIAMFGARLNDVSNDASDINDAFDTAEALGGREVIFPDGSTYIGHTTIVCGPHSTIKASSAAEVHYDGSGCALEIDGASTAETVGRLHELPYVRRADSVDWNLGTDTTSVGVRVKDCKYDTFFVRGIKRFNRGLVLTTSAGNVVCNTFQLGVIQNNRISIDFSEVTASWGINQNTFIGGACVIDSGYTATTNRIYLNMPNAENNTNTFIGVNLEAGGNQSGLVCASSSNVFLNCRWEGCAAVAGYVTVSGNNNRFIGGAPLSSDTPPFVTWITDTGAGNVWWLANGLFFKYMAIDFQSPGKPLRFGNGTAYPAVPIGGFGTNRLSIGDSSTGSTRRWGMDQQEGAVVTSGATIPLRNALTLTYASGQTITGFTLGSISVSDTDAMIVLMATNANATLQHTASPSAAAGKFVLSGGVDLNLTANRPVLFHLSRGNAYQV